MTHVICPLYSDRRPAKQKARSACSDTMTYRPLPQWLPSWTHIPDDSVKGPWWADSHLSDASHDGLAPKNRQVSRTVLHFLHFLPTNSAYFISTSELLHINRTCNSWFWGIQACTSTKFSLVKHKYFTSKCLCKLFSKLLIKLVLLLIFTSCWCLY